MLKIGTIASHSALNIIAGAKAEGFDTKLYCEPSRFEFYRTFGLEDDIVLVESFADVLSLNLEDVILIPHGSFVAYIGAKEILDSDVKIFGNKNLLRWEEDRDLKAQLLRESGLKVPRTISAANDINCPVIAKTDGAAGGKGYFIAKDKAEAMASMKPNEQYTFQEYIVGTKVFVTFFNSLARNRLEIFGADIRYETDADANLRFDERPSFIVVGNLPLVLRESTLAEYHNIGVSFIRAFERLTGQTVPGPFCIETIIDRHQDIYCFEFSGRIVAGTNVWIPSSPYSFLQFEEPMWMGKRIAREIRELKDLGRLEEALR